jgi:hypothetical protein
LLFSHYEEGIRYPVIICLKKTGKYLNFGSGPFIFESKKYDTLMESAISKNLFSEVLIVGDQNPLFIKRLSDNVLIVNTSSFIEHREHIVILVPQPRGYRWPCRLINEESH